MIKKKITRTAFLLLAAVAVFALSFIGARVGLTSSGAATENDDLSPATPSIALPGYDEICLFVFFECYEATYFRNGVRRKPTSRGLQAP